jgi:hypothetical protein
MPASVATEKWYSMEGWLSMKQLSTGWLFLLWPFREVFVQHRVLPTYFANSSALIFLHTPENWSIHAALFV